MADPLAPTTPDMNLAAGGKPTEVHIDQVNQWMRASPWYQDLLKSWGQNPTNVHLNDSQKHQIVRAAQAQGVVVDEGKMEVDPAGNFNPKGHKLRNTLIVAGIAGATIATMGAAGAFSGAALGPATAANMAATTAAASAVPSSLAGLTAAELATLGTTAAVGGTTAAVLGPATAANMAATSAASAAVPSSLAATSSGGGIGSTLLGAARNYLGGGGGGGGNGYLDTASRIASGLTDLQRGRAEGRERETMLAQGQNQSANQRYLAQLQAERDTLAAPATRAGNAVRGDILANAKPFAWTGGSDKVGNIPVPKFEGGMSPSMFSDATRTLGGLQSQEALSSQQAGSPVKAPSLIEGPQAGAGDSWLNTAATLASLGSQIPYGTKKKTVYNDGEIN